MMHLWPAWLDTQIALSCAQVAAALAMVSIAVVRRQRFRRLDAQLEDLIVRALSRRSPNRDGRSAAPLNGGDQ